MTFKPLEDNKIQLTGSLNFTTVPPLRKQFIDYLPAHRDIVVDLAAVGQCDSSGPALLLEFVRLSQAAQKKIKFINIPAQLQVLMQATAMTEILPTE